MIGASRSTPADPRERFRYLTSNEGLSGHHASEAGPGFEQPPDPGRPEGQALRPRRLWRFFSPFAAAVGKRGIVGILTLVAVIFLTYFGMDMAREVDPYASLANAAGKTPAYVASLVQGELGRTEEYGFSRQPIEVKTILPEIILRSAGLLFVSIALAASVGVPIGLWSAMRNGAGWSLATLGVTLLGVSLPSFFLALILQLGVIQLTRWAGGTVLPVGGFGWDAHLLLPAVVLAARPMAQIARVTHSSIKDVLESDYIRTAYGKGLHRRQVINRHVIRNAAVPILTTIGLGFRFALISLPVVEFFFGWPGLGFNLLKAITAQEYEFAIAMLLALAILFILVNMLLELSYRIIDPRIRDESQSAVRHESRSLVEMLRSFAEGVIRLVTENRLARRFRYRGEEHREDVITAYGAAPLEDQEPDRMEFAKRTRKIWVKGTLGNPALLLGGSLVLVLTFIVLFGSKVAPHSPFTTRGFTIEGGEYSVPPFEPDDTYPWGTDMLGRDILSLILAGAQQTFILATIVVIARLGVGFVLGAAAGWWQGSWLDRALLGLVEIIAAFPALLLAMVLILALNIRNGMAPFIVALCVVGWGEIMQFVRGEVIRLKPSKFIESAVAAGASTTRIVTSHVQPNLIPVMISILALEMGAVLMLLGELGFLGIFIGGGIFAELEWMAPLFHYSDVPEWGAMLSNVRTYARSHTWMAIYPSLAFFVAIFAFNLFGEGLRQLIDRVGVRVTRFFNRYTIVLGFAGVLGLLYIRGSTGAITVYARQANAFDAERVETDIEALSRPILDGRALDTVGMSVTAQWIASEFETLGLQPAGKEFTYFQERKRAYERLTGIPSLAFDDWGAALKYSVDYNIYPSLHAVTGLVSAPVRVLLLGEISSREQLGYTYYNLEDLVFSGEVLLVLEEDMFFIEQIPKAGALVISSNPAVLRQRHTLSPYGMFGREGPLFWISEETANRLLAPSGLSVRDLYGLHDGLATDETFDEALKPMAGMSVEGESHTDVPVSNVIGHWQGYVSNEFEGIDDELILVLTRYDCPPLGPDGELHPCANDNASGVGMMLEIIRNMKETGYQPYRTFLFVAYAGEGFQGGGVYTTEDINQFLEAKYAFIRHYDVIAVIELQGVAGGGGDQLLVDSKGSLRLAKLFESAAKRVNLPIQLSGEAQDLSRIFDAGSEQEGGEEAPRIVLAWEGAEDLRYTVLDTPDGISRENLEKVGRALGLTLMILGRELDY
jgi:peptide/nickel transport system permease protein